MKIRNLFIIGILLYFIGFTACRDDFEFELASNELGFSSDTISMDTIFNHTNSQTYKFTVHNRQDKDIEIPRIYLSRGEDSFYRVNVDGQSGFNFENVAIRAKDSIFVFVEIAAGDAPVNPLYEDELNFETTQQTQQVKLLSWIERAKFYNTDNQDGFVLNESTWDNQYARVIFGKVQANNLTIEPGTKVYFHHNAGLTINNSLTVNGNLNNKVVIRNDRHDPRMDSIPNQWDKIKLQPNSTANINFAIIKNGNIGIEAENATVNISNTQILNNELIGLYAINSNVTGSNLVINNSNLASLAIDGGTSTFTHCTFANYHNIGQGAGGNYSLHLSNDAGPLVQANFYNSIFYGRNSNAIYFDNIGSGSFNYLFDHNLIRDDFEQLPTTGMVQIIKDDPMYKDPGFGNNNVRLLQDSPAIGKGSSAYSNLIPIDLDGVSRSNSPNLGAYQTVVTND